MTTTTSLATVYHPTYRRNDSLHDTLVATCRAAECDAPTEIVDHRFETMETLRVFHTDPLYGGEAYFLDVTSRHLLDERRGAQFDTLWDWLEALHTPPAGSDAAYRQALDYLLEASE